MFNKKFQRKQEDFICKKCGNFTQGNGYTNHCPKCLWSLHIDINPGDRQEKCQGMMEPVNIEIQAGEYSVLQKCQKCGFERRNKIGESDDFTAVLKLAKDLSEKFDK